MYKTQFPIFQNHPTLHYLDHAATSQKPAVVVDAVKTYLENDYGSPHRGAHALSVRSTHFYDEGREKVKIFFDTPQSSELIFTRNTTESLNLIAYSYGLNFLTEGDVILVVLSAHHSNLVPWQFVAQKTGAILQFIEVNEKGVIPESEYDKITEKVKILAFPWISNGTGVIHPAKRLIEAAHQVGAVAVLDGAQAAGHIDVDLQALDPDFFVFSGHKMFALQGIGGLIAKKELLDKMPPFLMGGDMIEYVERQETTFAPVPEKFEAGTQNVAGVISLAKAVDFINDVGISNIEHYEKQMTNMAYDALSELDFVTIIGDKEGRGALITFTVDGVHPHDVATILDDDNVAIRAGHHCTQPVMKTLGLPSTCRASFSIYTDEADIEALVRGLKRVREVFGYGN